MRLQSEVSAAASADAGSVATTAPAGAFPQGLGSAAEVEFIGSPFTELPRLALYELRVS